jgi:hypothetical protein
VLSDTAAINWPKNWVVPPKSRWHPTPSLSGVIEQAEATMAARPQFRTLIFALALAALPVAPALAGRATGARHSLTRQAGDAPRYGILSPAQRFRFSLYRPQPATNARRNEQRLLRSDWHYIVRHMPPHLFPAGGFTSSASAAGFDWRDAAIGAPVAVALMLLAAGVLSARKRRDGTRAALSAGRQNGRLGVWRRTSA